MRRCQCPSYKDNEKIIPLYIEHCLAVLLKTLACLKNDLWCFIFLWSMHWIEISSWTSTLTEGPKYVVAEYIKEDYPNSGAWKKEQELFKTWIGTWPLGGKKHC